ncbi:RNA-directed DNA polymerase protein [Dioscorea alata]|uniref:RNA-directed DNA polymerase protein n=1 Tax=Dioscorea alata TaxID=55571 RepID=A0ACB7V9A4_DIOAL|nr:RNA-directed DNA polymerase protein [Dioscorea alata]
MASNKAEPHSNSVWLIDSGCSNHMTCDKTLFSSLDESMKVSVRLGDNKEKKVEGVGVVTILSQSGDEKRLHGMQYVPGLAHNLLSVGQLITKGYSVTFKDNKCVISGNKASNQVIEIMRSRNNMFPIDMASMEFMNVDVKNQSTEELWHCGLGTSITEV